jgi:hypothetical protein
MIEKRTVESELSERTHQCSQRGNMSFDLALWFHNVYAEYSFRSRYLSVSKHLIASHLRCYATQRFLRSVLGLCFG